MVGKLRVQYCKDSFETVRCFNGVKLFSKSANSILFYWYPPALQVVAWQTSISLQHDDVNICQFKSQTIYFDRILSLKDIGLQRYKDLKIRVSGKTLIPFLQVEAVHCVSMMNGDLERAVQLLITRAELGQDIKPNQTQVHIK